jgi:hypothetical protein
LPGYSLTHTSHPRSFCIARSCSIARCSRLSQMGNTSRYSRSSPPDNTCRCSTYHPNCSMSRRSRTCLGRRRKSHNGHSRSFDTHNSHSRKSRHSSASRQGSRPRRHKPHPKYRSGIYLQEQHISYFVVLESDFSCPTLYFLPVILSSIR